MNHILVAKVGVKPTRDRGMNSARLSNRFAMLAGCVGFEPLEHLTILEIVVLPIKLAPCIGASEGN